MLAIERDIYNTLLYFSYFEYPTTIFEIWKWQYKPQRIYSFAEIERVLRMSEFLHSRVSEHENMFALGDIDSVKKWVQKRKLRYLDFARKEKKARKVANYLASLADIKAIALANNAAWQFTDKNSDIDFFIITKKGRVWSARFWAVIPFILLKQRPEECRRDPIDISFFVDENYLSLKKISLSDDPYLAHWIKSLLPVYGEGDIWERFFNANSWVDNVLPAAGWPIAAFKMQVKKIINIPALLPQKITRILQQRKFPADIRVLMNQNSNVIVNDKMLKFHKNDRRAEIAGYMASKYVKD